MNKLSARAIATLAEPGRHADGGGLYLVVGPGKSRRWVFMWKRQGRRRELGLGSARDVSLAQARAAAVEARRTVAEGGDPIAEKRAAPENALRVPTFGEMADAYVATMEPTFRNAKHIYQWRETLRTYAAPLRPKPVDQITTADVLDALRPIWNTKAETASRVRGRIERVLNAATAAGHRSGPNPAAWRNHLQNLLPKRHRLTRGHLAAMPYPEVPAFMVRLRASEGVSARAFEFAVLTAARTGEVLGARWAEMDLDAAVWTVPAFRMKAGKEHRVPLTEQALVILREMQQARVSDCVFPGQRPGRPLTNMALTMQLRRMKADAYTVHGFRSSFRDWCGNETAFPREVAEAALAHRVGDATELAYRRSDALAKRRKLMQAWAGHCGREDAGASVAPLKRPETA